MASGASVDHVFGGCIASEDFRIEKRPYHRNCSCALHKSGEDNNHCSHSPHHKVSYPIRRSWSEGCLVAMMTSPSTGSSSSCSSSPAPAAPAPARLPPHVRNQQLKC